jgi:hypothetical protein
LGEGAGDGASSSNHSNFFGEAAGFGSTAASNSNFLGLSAGSLAPNAQRSNFLGLSAGANATNAAHSNFLGNLAGSAATNASNSNFFGQDAGNGATNAANAIFIGRSAGINDTVNNTVSDLSSILIGQYTNTGGFSNSIILGSGTSVSAISNTKANQFMLAPTITEARWRGVDYTFPSAQAAGAGYVLTNNGSGVLSWTTAGSGGSTTLQTNGVTNGSQALLNLIEGTNIDITDNGTGGVTIDASIPSVDTIYTDDGTLSGSRTIDLAGNDLNFVDSGSGNKVGIYIDAGGTISNFGSDPTDGLAYIQVDNNNDRITLQATTLNIPTGATDGYVLTSDGSGNATWQTGGSGTVTSINVGGSGALSFTGGPVTTSGTISASWGGSTAQYVRGDGTLDTFPTLSTPVITVINSSTLASTAIGGGQSSSAIFSVFLGNTAGGGTNASGSFFGGFQAGNGATNAQLSNFIGYEAGKSATDAESSNFIGWQAGINATNARFSNFIGTTAGHTATNAQRSNFIGPNAGYLATNAADANFFGFNAGRADLNAANAIFIGTNAGYSTADISLNNTASYDDVSTFANTSILVGHSTSTGGFSNSIAIGAYATNTASNQFMIGSTTRPIDTTRINGSASTQCTITTGTGIACTSDERLKTDIADLPPSTLDTLLNVRTVTYHWLQNPASPEQIGFLAQDLEHYFPQLVATDSQGYKSVYYAQITPILVEAIREMNLKITDIGDLTKDNSWRTALLNWFASASNGITEFFAGEITTKTLCVADESGEKTCLTKGQLDSVLNNLGNTTIVMPMPAPEATSSEPAPTTESQPTLETSDTPESPAEFAPAPEVVSESSNTAPAE